MAIMGKRERKYGKIREVSPDGILILIYMANTFNRIKEGYLQTLGISQPFLLCHFLTSFTLHSQTIPSVPVFKQDKEC